LASGDPELVVITPHNEAIRFEFGQGFSHWHQQIMENPSKSIAFAGWYDGDHALSGSDFSCLLPRLLQRSGKEWPAAATQRLMDSHYTPDGSSIDALYQTFRSPTIPVLSAPISMVFFGGGRI